MTGEKVKLYKNAAREADNKATVSNACVPEYKNRGIIPEKVDGRNFPGMQVLAGGNPPDANPRTRSLCAEVPYAEAAEIEGAVIGNDPIPNVGNNMEQTWMYVDGNMLDDISDVIIDKINDETPMIDNNDIVTVLEDKPFMTEKDLQDLKDDEFSNIKDDSYILIVNGSILSIGEKNEIQEIASSLIFGEHPLCEGIAIPVEDIVVLKKVNIKVGLFLE